MPAPADSNDNVLRGSVRYIEHHGHESLAYLDIGATAVTIDEVHAVDLAAEAPPKRRMSSLFRQVTGRSGGLGSALLDEPSGEIRPAAPQTVFGDPHRRHRRPAEFVVRMPPYPGGGPGQPMTVAVRLDQAHFFDERGDRIDVGWR